LDIYVRVKDKECYVSCAREGVAYSAMRFIPELICVPSFLFFLAILIRF